MTNIFRPSRPEMQMLRKAFLESSKLLGRTCRLVQPASRDIPMYSTTERYNYSTSPELPYFIHIVSEPKKKMLEAFGWNAESGDEKPMIADCPMYRYPVAKDSLAVRLKVGGADVVPVKLTEGCLIKLDIYDDTSVVPIVQTFEIEKVIAGDDSVRYLINLVPFRSLTEGMLEVDRPDSGAVFIQQSDERD